MSKPFAAALLLLAGAASAQSFDAANKSHSERSYSRACDGFTAFLKANPTSPLVREATAKRADACLHVGKGTWSELQQIARAGEKDFARAWANYALFVRGNQPLDAALPLLEQAATGAGRTATEAKQMLVAGALLDLQRNSWDAKRANAMVARVMAHSTDATAIAHARLLRAQAQLSDAKLAPGAEKELASIGAGSTEYADDALYQLGQRHESLQRFTTALDVYDGLVSRFSPKTSNTYSSAKSRADAIRRPVLGLSVGAVDLPGITPQATVSWRNVESVTFTLHRVDPMGIDEKQIPWPSQESALMRGNPKAVKTWTQTFEVPSKHAPGSKSLDLDVPGAGLYVLEAQGGGQRAAEWVLLTKTAVVTKTDLTSVTVFVSDVESGAAQGNAEVALWVDQSGVDLKLIARTDVSGLARIAIPDGSRSMLVWTRAGDQLSAARAGQAWSARWSREELAYVLFDRPLYKPSESVRLKLFLRSREGGPSTPITGRPARILVRDPTGKDVLDQQVTTGRFGTAHAELTLPKDATLGQYSVSISSPSHGYRSNSTVFRVEEYKPPEYIVGVEPIGTPRPEEAMKFRVKAKYYSGGPVPNAKGRAIVTVQGWQHSFGAWPDDSGEQDDDGAGGYDEEAEMYSGRRGRHRYRPYYGSLAQHTLVFVTGPDGTAEVTIPALPNPPGTDVEARVQVYVTDASRREIEGGGTLRASTRPWFVDLKTDHYLYKPGERVAVRLRSEDANGRPMSPEVLVRLSRIDNEGNTTRIAEVRSQLKDGAGLAVLDADALGQVRAEVRDPKAPDTVLAQTDLWLTSDTKPMAPPQQGFQLYVDRAPLVVGESVRALVVANQPGGHALVTIESDQVHFATVVPLLGRARFLTIPLTAAMAPNAWLHAARFEASAPQHQQRPVKVRGSEVHLNVSVGFTPQVAEPGSTVTAAIAVANAPKGLKTETALTVVDEALFAIQPEQKDFLPFFGRTQRQLTVRTQTSHNERWYRPRPLPPEPKKPTAQPKPDATANLDAPKTTALRQPAPAPPALGDMASAGAAMPAEEREASGERASSKKELAGPGKRKSAESSRDEDDAFDTKDGAAAPVKARTDFGSSAGWFPALVAGGVKQTQKVTLTDSLTSWKAIATVVSEGPHLGVGAGTMRAEKPLMVRLQGPRFFIEGDEVVLSAVVDSRLTTTTTVDVEVSAPGFKALTPARGTLKVAPNAPARFDARFKVVSLGDQVIKATARGGGKADAMQWTLPALVHGSAQRQYSAQRLDDRLRFEFDLPEKRKASETRFELTLSPSLLSVMFDALPYLAQYPYGCTEQTLSRFVPATIAQRAVKDLGLPADRVPKDLDDMVKKGLSRLQSFQHGDGGWGWWQTDTTNTWMTAYVVYALSLAKEAGVAVDSNMLSRGRSALLDRLGAAQNEPETFAFALFALTQTGAVPRKSLDKAFSIRTRLSPRARALVALSLLNAKDRRARIAVENLDDVVKAAATRKDAAVGEVHDAWSTSAAIEATAFTLMAMARYDKASPNIPALTDFLVLRRNGGRWRNTRDTAFATYALSDLARLERAAHSSGTFVVLVNGKEVKRVRYGQGGMDLLEPLVLGDSAFRAGKNVIELKRDGGGTGYAAATFDVFNQNDFIKGVGGDVKVRRTYTLLGKPSTEKGAAPTEYGMPVESGVRVRVDVDITANKAVEFVMLEDLKPAGFEAVLQRSGPEVCAYACTHAELRTDRVAMFLTSLRIGTTRLSYELRAEVPGRFSALPARFEAMYAPEIQATADEMRFEVRDEPSGVAGH